MTQDDAREIQTSDYCGLIHSEFRVGPDATDILGNKYELKSTTSKRNLGVSTTNKCTFNKIAYWRTVYWIVAGGPKTSCGMQFKEIYMIHPVDLEVFFLKREEQLLVRRVIALEMYYAYKNIETSKEKLMMAIRVCKSGIQLLDKVLPCSLIRQVGTSLPVDNSELAKKMVLEFAMMRPIAG